ncbi:hypothetical protein PCC8801_0511 [Rippkaea orientalis PCC 8801]|uniref:Uncharacterized protein n=1 Tax=Rippkaea orientalis (strain PCC 8801 / RF-1) TaxID=41431 RepID=B7JVN1_RIPO1|nr:hypothetical protein [Rippkaea orientalis]ACK64602.1 hypothetical protein PCC8801_0511 [Rippkaea orientalis PCC 8801]
MTNSNKKMLLFQAGTQGWKNPQPNNAIISKRIQPKLTTKELIDLTKIPPHKLPRIGGYLTWKGYFIIHSAKNLWQVCQPLAA